MVADHATIDNLDANYAHISNGVIDNATIGYADVNQLDTNFARINLENVNNSWIANGTIKNAAITDAQIIGVSANKLTAGTIDASKINVTNLRADSLEVKRINGQPILGGYTAVNSSASGYDQANPSENGWYELTGGNFVLTSDTSVNPNKAYYTTSTSVALYDQTYINNLESDLNDRIDGAIETWTGSVAPTLNNYPASSWTTDDSKSSHVGDIYYVLNASQSTDGYCYRFAYDSTSQEFDWVLIKDSDVTAALSRLLTAENKIDGLESFETDTSSWMDETDESLTSIRTQMTTLETSLGDKVSTSTFNTLEATVNSNSADITTLNDVVINGYTDEHSVTHNSLVQTSETNSSTISQLATTLGTNADGTTKAGDVVQRTTAVEQDLSGFKSTVSNTYATNSTVSQLQTTVAQTAEDVTTVIESMTSSSQNLITYFPDPVSKIDNMYNNPMKASSGAVRWGPLYAVDGEASSWANGAPYVRNYASGQAASTRYFMFCPFQKNIFKPGDDVKIEARVYNRDATVSNAKVIVWFYSEYSKSAGTSTNVGNSSVEFTLTGSAETVIDTVIHIPTTADFSNRLYYVIGIDAQSATRMELSSASVAFRIDNYAKSTKNTADNISTMIRQYGDGVLVCKTNNTVGALVNANGSFDVVSVTWSNGTPTAGSVISSYGSNEIIVGEANGYNSQLTSSNLKFRYGTTQLASYTNSTITLGQTSGTNKNIYFGPSNIYFRSGTTNLAQISASNIKLGTTDSANVNLSTSALTFNYGSTQCAIFSSQNITLNGDEITLYAGSGAGTISIYDDGSSGSGLMIKNSANKIIFNMRNNATDMPYFAISNASGAERSTTFISGSTIFRNVGETTSPIVSQDITCTADHHYAGSIYEHVTGDWMVYSGTLNHTSSSTQSGSYRLFYTGSGNLRTDVYENGAWTARYFYIQGQDGLNAANITAGTLPDARLAAPTDSTATSQITAATGFEVVQCSTTIFGGHVVSVRIAIKTTNALTAGTQYTVGTFAAKFKPHANMYLNPANANDTGAWWVTTAGAIVFKPGTARSANTTHYASGTWVTAS